MRKDKALGIVVFFILITFIIYSINKKKKLSQLPQKYVIGRVTKVGKSTSGGYYINYRYQIHSSTYDNTIAFGYGDKVFKDDEFLVSIPKGQEDHGLLLVNCSVKKGSLISPEEGWSEKPIRCD